MQTKIIDLDIHGHNYEVFVSEYIDTGFTYKELTISGYVSKSGNNCVFGLHKFSDEIIIQLTIISNAKIILDMINECIKEIENIKNNI